MSLKTRKKYKQDNVMVKSIKNTFELLLGILCLLSPIILLIGFLFYLKSYTILIYGSLLVLGSFILAMLVVKGLLLLDLLQK